MLRKVMLPNAMLPQLEPAGSKHSDVRGKYPSKLKVCNSSNQAPPGWDGRGGRSEVILGTCKATM